MSNKPATEDTLGEVRDAIADVGGDASPVAVSGFNPDSTPAAIGSPSIVTTGDTAYSNNFTPGHEKILVRGLVFATGSKVLSDLKLWVEVDDSGGTTFARWLSSNWALLDPVTGSPGFFSFVKEISVRPGGNHRIGMTATATGTGSAGFDLSFS